MAKEEEDIVMIEGGDTEDKIEYSAKENAETLATITADCNNVLALLQSVAVKSPRIIATLLSLHTDKRACIWFCRWAGNNLPPTTNAPQDHRRLTGVLSDVATGIQHTKALRPVVATQDKA